MTYRFRGDTPPTASSRASILTPETSSDGLVDLYLDDPIDSWGGYWGVSAKEFGEALASLPDDITEIRLHINSPGGEVYAGLGILDTMNFIKPDVSTICVGMAASMASVLLAAGTPGKRLALPNSMIMIHQPSSGAQGQQTDIQIVADETKYIREHMNELLAQYTGQSVEKINADTERDNYLRAQEAKEYGLVDKVIASRNEQA